MERNHAYAFTVRTRSVRWLPGLRFVVNSQYTLEAPAAVANKSLLWWIYAVDTMLLLALGVAFFNNGPWIGQGFGIVPNGSPIYWPAAGVTRLLGGALIAFAMAAMAIWRAPEVAVQEAAAKYFRYAHFALALVCWVQQISTLNGRGGFLLFDILLLPLGLFCYHWLTVRDKSTAPASSLAELRSEWEVRIREAAGQQERSRLAQELHDSIKQQLYAIQTHLAAAEARSGAASPAAEPIEHARTSARQAMSEMNSLLDQLRASPLETVGLVEALRQQCEALGYRTGATVTAQIGEGFDTADLPPATPPELFRIAQEALSNVARHARAKTVTLSLARFADSIALTIRDDGQGFTPAAAPGSGMGLSSMRKRAASLGGLLTIDSRPDAGCTVTVQVPLETFDAGKERRYWRMAAGSAAFGGTLAWMTHGRIFEAHLVPVLGIIGLVAAVHAVLAWRSRKRA